MRSWRPRARCDTKSGRHRSVSKPAHPEGVAHRPAVRGVTARCSFLLARMVGSPIWIRTFGTASTKARDFPEAFRASAIIWQPRKACKFPVFSLLAGNFRDSETSSHMTPSSQHDAADGGH